MVEVVNASSTSLSAVLDHRRAVPPYERTQRQIEDEVVEFSRAITRDAGMPLLPLDSRGDALIATGRAVQWGGMSLLPIALLSGFFFNAAHQKVGAIFCSGVVLGVFGGWLITRGRDRLRRRAGKPSLDRGRESMNAYLARVISRALLAIGIAIGVILNVLAIYSGQAGRTWFQWLGGLALVLVFTGLLLAKWARQLQQPSASKLHAADTRAPILFLRSFGDEDIIVSSTTGDSTTFGLKKDPFQDPFRRGGYIRLEEAVADQLSTFGPLIAIGKPGERLPHLGAARNYYADADWQEAARRWMNDARIVVVVAGLTGGLRWEMEEITRSCLLPKLMVIVPPSKEDLRWQILREELSSALTPAAIPAQMPANLRVLHINAQRHLVAVCTSGNSDDDYERAIRFGVYGMFCHMNDFDRKPDLSGG